jgi:hypothetical protein
MGITVYKDDNIIIIQYPNGEMTIDKNIHRMISWIGVGTYGDKD